MLALFEFEVLSALAQTNGLTQREIANKTQMSLASVNRSHSSLQKKGCLDEQGKVTSIGLKALAPYKVDNAVILAAGAATRLSPLSFEKPKAMFEVKGEVLIERMIRQLREAGIDDITIVVGYMKEMFFYLEEDFNVKILVNPEYANRNNHSSLLAAKEKLGNTYILPADQYYSENIFNRYAYQPYICASFCDHGIEEQVLTLGPRKRITAISKSGSNAYYINGPAYFDREFSQKLVQIIEHEYNMPQTATKLWDEILADHLDELDIAMREYKDVVNEFDFITDLTQFDSDFFNNVDSKILDNICKTLECTRDDISNVEPIKAGLTNLSVLFEAKGTKYVYRHPGNGTDEIVNRKAEAHALNIAKKIGLDNTFVYEDPNEGWKISVFIEGCSDFDYRNHEHVAKGLQMIKTLHTSGETSPWSFSFSDEATKIVQLLRDRKYHLPRDFSNLEAMALDVGAKMKAEQGKPVLCHNDFYGPNFLVRGNEMQLIDWEYAAMGDYACDLGNFIAQGSGYSVDESREVLELYYGRKPTFEEERHCLAAIGIVGYYWYVWAMYKEAMGNPVGDWLYVWYKAAKQYMAAAQEMY